MNESWKYIFTERELKEIEFWRVYAQDFAHGTDGHTIRIIVAKMEKLLLEREVVAPNTIVETVNLAQPDVVYSIGNDKPVATIGDSHRCLECG